MHKFELSPCRVQNGEGDSYNGTVVVLSSKATENLALFFPISEDNASLVNYVLQDDNREKINVNQDVIGIYKTMIDSWKAGDKFISGIVIDTRFVTDVNEDVLEAAIVLIDTEGNLDAFVKTSFVHAMVIAAMEDLDITVTGDLFQKLYPKGEDEVADDADGEEDEEDEDEDDDKGSGSKPKRSPPKKPTQKDKYPVDNDVIAIARKIISGNISEK